MKSTTKNLINIKVKKIVNFGSKPIIDVRVYGT